MPEPDLFQLGGAAPSPAAPSTAPDTTGGDPAVWTLLGETSPNDPNGQLAVGSTIFNRAAKQRRSFQDVVADPANGYEAWQDAKARAATQRRYPVGSAAYQSAQQVLADLQSGKTAPQPYTHFDSPSVLASRGKPEPDWTKGQTGTDIAGNRFYSLPDQLGAPEPDLMALGGVAPPGGVKGVPGAQYTPGTAAGKPPDAQALAFSFLAQHGFRDEDAPLGSSTNPAGQLPGKGMPSEPDSWYVTPQGQLRKTGDDTPDYLPQYQKLASLRATAAAAPIPGRLATAVGQGVWGDVAGSIDKLTGGLAGVPTPNVYASADDALLPDNDAQLAQQGLAYFQNRRNQYDLLHHGDPLMAGARFVGQAVPITALTMGTGETLGGAGPVGEFLTGDGGANLLTQGASRATAGALQGAQASALTSSTNDRPLAEQVETGAMLGGGLGAAAPALSGLGQRAIYGNPLASSPVTDLADTALSKYGIPLRAGQIRGAAGDRGAAIADSNLLGASPKFAANNNAQKGAFMRGMTAAYGDASGDVSPEAMTAAKARVVTPMNDVASRTPIGGPTDPIGPLRVTALRTTLDGIVSEASKVLPDSEMAPLRAQVADVQSAIKNGQLSGESYQAITRNNAPLDRLQRSPDTNVSHYASQMREALDDALEHAARPEDIAALRQARWQYKNLMTVAKLAPKADANGFISPALLRGAVNTNFKNSAFKGAGDLGELAQIGQTFMKEPPQSGTAPRIADMVKHIGVGGLLSGEMLAAYMHDPKLAVGALSPLLIQKAAQMAKEARLGLGATNRLLGHNPPSPLNAVAPYLIPSGVLAGQNLPANPLVAQPHP